MDVIVPRDAQVRSGRRGARSSSTSACSTCSVRLRRGHAGRAADCGPRSSPVDPRHAHGVAGQPATGPSGTAAARPGAPRADALHRRSTSPVWRSAIACLTISHYVLDLRSPLADNIAPTSIGHRASARCSGSGPTAGSSSPARSSRPRRPRSPAADLGVRQPSPPRRGTARRAPAWPARARAARRWTRRGRGRGRGPDRCPAAGDRALEDVRGDRRRHTVTLVADLDDDRGAAAAGVHVDGAAAVDQGVLEQGGQHLGQRDRRRPDARARARR